MAWQLSQKAQANCYTPTLQLEHVFTRLINTIKFSWLAVVVKSVPINVPGDMNILQVEAILYTHVVVSNVFGHCGRTEVEVTTGEHHS